VAVAVRDLLAGTLAGTVAEKLPMQLASVLTTNWPV